jgi:hypothetical protein
VSSDLLIAFQRVLGHAALPLDVFSSCFSGNVLDISIDRLLTEQRRSDKLRVCKLFSELVGRLEYCCEYSRVFDSVTFEDGAEASGWERRLEKPPIQLSGRSRALMGTEDRLQLPSSCEFALLRLTRAFDVVVHEANLVDVAFNSPVDVERLARQAGVTALVSTYADHEIRWLVYMSNAEIADEFLKPAAIEVNTDHQEP